MIAITKRKFGASVSDVFFASDPDALSTGSSICFFVQAHEPHPGLVPFRTRIIDLSRDEASLFSALSSSTRYKIKRAEREGLAPSINLHPAPADLEEYADYYDEFARQKGVHTAGRDKLAALAEQKALVLTAVRDGDGRVLCAHAFISDRELRRARLLYSASHFRGTDDSGERNLIGRANRLLHWYEIREFKRLEYLQYDLGGVAENDDDPAKRAIAQFKLEFGGEQVVEYNGFVPKSGFGKVLLALKRRLK